MKPNPIRDFGVDRSTVRFLGRDLQRPECILAEPDGTLWAADARGGVVCIRPDGEQQVITQRRSSDFQSAGSEAARYLEGTLPNGLAFSRTGDFLISNFGTDCLEVMSRDGKSKVLVDSIDGAPIGKVNFVLRDSRDRVWITVSTRVTELDARPSHGSLRRLPCPLRERHLHHRRRRLPVYERDPVRRQGGVPLRRRDHGRLHQSPSDRRPRQRGRAGNLRADEAWVPAPGPTASRSTAMETCGALSCTRTSCSF